MVAYLKILGYGVNRKRVKRLMEKMGLYAIYPKRNTSKRNHEHKVYPYLFAGGPIWPLYTLSRHHIDIIPFGDQFTLDFYKLKQLSFIAKIRRCK